MSSSNSKEYRRYHTIYDEDLLVYPPSCKKADLTIDGQNQHENLGTFYRQYLIDEERILPDNLDPDFIQFRASEPERTVRSAESFIHGLYPPDHPDEIITIQTGTDLLELLHPRSGHCKDLTDVYNQWITSEEFLAKQNASAPHLRKLIEDSGFEWNEYQWLYVGDWLYTIGCCGNEIPSFITQEQLDVAMDAVEFFTLKFFTMKRGVAGASIMREVLMQIERAVTGTTNTKFVLMSAHDVSIVSALDVLGIHLQHIPPFASHLAFEVWKINEVFNIRVVLNGEVMLGPIPLTKFKSIIGPYLSYCPELGDFF
jgi:acid phosphatase